MLRITTLGLVVASVFLASPLSTTAQNTVLLAELYGEGAHAYFAGDHRQAYQSLSSALEGGSNDPRVYYFRGLTLLQLGRSDEAEEDFASGAEAEVRDADRYYDVDMSLQRVQGASRLTIEDYRQRARIAAAEQAQQQQQARYERRQGNEAAVIRQPFVLSSGGDELPVPDDTAESGEDLFSPDGGLTGGVTDVPAENSRPIDLFDQPASGLRGTDSFDENPFADEGGPPFEDETPEFSPAASGESSESESGSFSMRGLVQSLVPAILGGEDEASEGFEQFPGGFPGGFPGDAGGLPGDTGGFPGDAGGFPDGEGEFQGSGPDGESDEATDPFSDDDFFGEEEEVED